MEKEAVSLLGGMAQHAPRFLRSSKDIPLMQGTKIKPLSSQKVEAYQKEKLVDEGNGLFGNMGLGAIGLVSKKTGDNLKNKIADLKTKLSDFDQRAAQKVIDTSKMKEGGFWHKRMTVNKPVPVAEYTEGVRLPNGGGTERKRLLYDNETRVPSLFASAQQGMQVATPILGSLYVADKLFPGEEQTAADVAQIEMEKLSAELDKVAALQKVAALEERVEQTESMLKTANEENKFYRNRLEKETLEKQAALDKTAELQQALFEKEAAYEEFFLRVKARERSKGAVKLAESMLEVGLIKQAHFKNKVDFLMDCDDETFKMHHNLLKTASYGEKGLESLALFIENVDREEVPNRANLSIKGETIGEAALDLLKK